MAVDCARMAHTRPGETLTHDEIADLCGLARPTIISIEQSAISKFENEKNILWSLRKRLMT